MLLLQLFFIAAVGAIKLLVDTAETSNNAALLVKIGAVEPDLTTTLTTNFATLTGKLNFRSKYSPITKHDTE